MEKIKWNHDGDDFSSCLGISQDRASVLKDATKIALFGLIREGEVTTSTITEAYCDLAANENERVFLAFQAAVTTIGNIVGKDAMDEAGIESTKYANQ